MPRTIGAIALALVIAGCQDTSLPVGDYSLVGSAAGSLPLKLDSEDQCFHMLMGGRLNIMRDATYRSVLNVEIACPGQGVNHRDINSAGELTRSDTLLSFRDSTGQYVGTGKVVGAGDTVSIVGAIHRLIFARAQ